MTGLMVKIIARVNQNELNRYEKLFNTANAVFKNILPTSFQDEQLKKKQKKTQKKYDFVWTSNFFF
jgi:preprotein translocase subunit SecA